jgi:transcriptional regulator with XRE-family HTH domain
MMTHFQDVFIRNLRFYRTKKAISQLKFSVMIDVSPNYLNAVENGKNFPSPEVIQRISDTLEISPYQLFLEHPVNLSGALPGEEIVLIQELSQIRQKFVKDIDGIIEKYGQS